MSRDWDNDEARAWATRLHDRRKNVPSVGDAKTPRASAAFKWLFESIDLVGASQKLVSSERYAVPIGDAPGRLRPMLMECTKPFVLWNCDRDEGDGIEEFRMEKGPKFTIGQAAGEAARTREGMPGKVRGTSKMLVDDVEERDLLRRQAFAAKKQLKRYMTTSPEDNGIGVPDPDGPPPEPTPEDS